MPRSAVAAVLLLCLASLGCDVSGWLRIRGIRSFREVSVEQARALLERPGSLLVQVGRPAEDLGREPDTLLEEPGADWPEGLSRAPGPVVVVSTDPEVAANLAARLARAGVERVAAVRKPEAQPGEAQAALLRARKGGEGRNPVAAGRARLEEEPWLE
jgi:hypothetical protein